jgi:hypothetical protein
MHVDDSSLKTEKTIDLKKHYEGRSNPYPANITHQVDCNCGSTLYVEALRDEASRSGSTLYVTEEK